MTVERLCLKSLVLKTKIEKLENPEKCSHTCCFDKITQFFSFNKIQKSIMILDYYLYLS